MNGSGAQANHYCRCNGDKPNADKVNIDPPTYFDYVPQFLRWFEEWAEDFCRKKKKKVENVKKQCREKDKSGKDRYCSRNGYDCEKTKRAIGKFRFGKQCISCLYACNPYVEWIENQRKQFLKQKQRYENVINGTSGNRGRQRRGTTTTNYDGYEKKFYEQLKKSRYGTVDGFLELLSKEKACTAVDDDKGGTIHFETVGTTTTIGENGVPSGASGTNVESQGTFYRSKYCQPCPYCGVKKNNNGIGWEEKSENDQCDRQKLYKPRDGAEGTNIKILKSGENHDDIKEKIEDFCKTQNGTGGGAGGAGGKNSNNQELYEEWKCYQFDQLEKVGEGEEDEEYDNDVQNGGGLCILKKENKIGKMNADEPAEIQKTYNDFFYYWVAHMLKDSIHWRTKKLEKCLKNGKTMKCKEWCNNDCECFKKWIGKKENEWKAIKDHFNTQEGFDSEGDKGIPVGGGFGFTHDVVLQENLKLQFLNEDSTQDTQNSLNAEELKHLKQLSEMLQNENAQQTAGATGKKTLMDKLIDYEKEEAKTCLDTHKSDPCPLPEEDKDIPPSADPSSPPAERIDTDADDTASDDEDEDEEEEEEEETEEEDNQKETETVEPAPKEPAVKKEEVKVCETVKSALTIDNLTKACQQKYEKGREKFPNWKCIPTNTNDVATMEGSSESGNRSKRHTDSTVTAPGKSGATTGVTTTRSSGESTSDKGSICVPPRRRRLYIQKLVEWAKNYNTETSQAEGSSEQSVQSTRNGGTEGASSGPSTSEGSAQTASQPNSRPTSATASSHAPNGDALLLTAFVESAAVE
ncbi:hypothetical protein PFFCH_05720, partial [Plasmodium falciparum FCH/4]